MENVAAIYLVGQGTYFRPRPIEVQFHRILRFAQLDKQKEPWFDPRAVFIDLSPRVWRSRALDLEKEFPQFLWLLDRVEQGEHKTVYVDFDTSTSNQFAGILLSMESLLSQIGARVFNCFDKTMDLQIEHVHLPFFQKGDASDFIAFFPNLTADICEMVLHNLELHQEKRSTIDKLRHRIEGLQKEQPNRATGNKWPLFPWWLDKSSGRSSIKS